MIGIGRAAAEILPLASGCATRRPNGPEEQAEQAQFDSENGYKAALLSTPSAPARWWPTARLIGHKLCAALTGRAVIQQLGQLLIHHRFRERQIRFPLTIAKKISFSASMAENW